MSKLDDARNINIKLSNEVTKIEDKTWDVQQEIRRKKQRLRPEIDAKLRARIDEDIRPEVEAEVRQQIKKELEPEVRKQAEAEVTAELIELISDEELKNQIKEEFDPESIKQVMQAKKKLLAEFEKKLSENSEEK